MTLEQAAPVAAALPAYEIGEELGRGQWGMVFGARHRQLGRDVAVKQLPPAYAGDPDVVRRFVNEAKVLGSLNHMHIVPIYDFVEHGGLCLLIMERLHGGTLGARRRAGGTRQDACAVALAAAAALHYAHQHGVLHRDVKPENIMFSREGVLKVTDFGIAKVVGGSRTITQTGLVLGTPAYIAPEQAKGEPLTPATDVYALGLVLYELLAGRLPFEGGDAVSMLYRHIYNQPIPLLDLAPEVPPEIAGAVMRAIERDPAGRYASAEAFGVALAASAREAWGPHWLSQTQITVGAPGAILAAAHGQRAAPQAAARPDPDVTLPPRPRAPPPPPPPSPPLAESPPPLRRARARAPIAAFLLVLAAIGAVAVLNPGGGEKPSSPVAAGPAPSPASGGWRPLRPVPTARQQAGAAAVAGTVWLAGGLAGEAVSRKVEGYDPAIDSWKAGPDLPVALHHTAAVAYRGELVVIGGWSPEGGQLNAVTSDRVYALRGGRWVPLPKLRHARAATAAAVVGDRIVVTGGQAGGRLVASTEVFDGRRWRDGEDLPHPREHLAAAADARHLYVVGGRDLGADRNSRRLDRYDPERDSWERLPDMPTARGGLAASLVQGQLVAVGGEQATGVNAEVEIYDPARRRWRAGPPLRTPRHGLAAVAQGSAIYVMAGAVDPSHATAVDALEVLRFAVAR